MALNTEGDHAQDCLDEGQGLGDDEIEEGGITPQENLVSVISTMLDMAQEGKITSFTGAALREDGAIAVYSANLDGESAFPIMGALNAINTNLGGRFML